MHRKAVEFHTLLYERLQDEAYALDYLNASLQDGDSRVLLMAIKNIVAAKMRFSH